MYIIEKGMRNVILLKYATFVTEKKSSITTVRNVTVSWPFGEQEIANLAKLSTMHMGVKKKSNLSVICLLMLEERKHDN